MLVSVSKNINIVGQDYLEYLDHNAHRLDYVMVDPPWYYGGHGQSNSYTFDPNKPDITEFDKWGENNTAELIGILSILDPTVTRAVCIWTTIPMIKHVFQAIEQFHGCQFEYRSMITWEKLHQSGAPAPVLAYYFMNTTEHLVILFNKNRVRGVPPRTNIKTCRHHQRYTGGHTTCKPKELESDLMNAWPGQWAYLFSGMHVDKLNLKNSKLDAVDLCFCK